MEYVYTPKGVCSRQMIIKVNEDGIIESVQIIGGCDGNTQGVSRLAEGMHIDKVISLLKGIDCKGRGTSCPDQLAIALEEIKEKMNV